MHMKKSSIIIILLPITIVFIFSVWFLMNIFEGKKPQAEINPLPDYINKEWNFNLNVSDLGMGLKDLKVDLRQDGPAITILEKSFPYEGMFNKKGIHSTKEEFAVDPKKLGLVQGKVNLYIEIHDFSKRRGGDGNLTIVEHKMTVDTIPPSISAITRAHYINIGGSGLIIYKISTDTSESGVFVGDTFFKGAPFIDYENEGIYVCYFAVPFDFKKGDELYLWAKDRADNERKNSFYYHIRLKKFHSDSITITDQILDKLIPNFDAGLFKPDDNNIEKYLFLNKTLRKENHTALRELCQYPTNEKLWDGKWLRMKNAATMASFADRRAYYYKGELIDEEVHLGVDLASLRMSPVQAANAGKVIYAQDLGIYGQSVVIDHGQGLYSIYGHLSSIETTVDQPVSKGDVLGYTGSTGLATGDHLHFGFLVHGVPVNPIEWWDSHWIKDNIYRKLDRVKKILEK